MFAPILTCSGMMFSRQCQTNKPPRKLRKTNMYAIVNSKLDIRLWLGTFDRDHSGFLEPTVQQQGPVSFLVDVGQGHIWRRHIDHIRSREEVSPVVDKTPEHSPLETDFEGPVLLASESEAEAPAQDVTTTDVAVTNSQPTPRYPA